MPELPEVETTVRGIRAALEGRTIVDAWFDFANGLATPDPTTFHARITGQTVREVTRRAKYIVIHLTDATLLIHLKMTGRVYVVPDDAEDYADQWVHFRFQLDNAQQLRFSDSRKFGRVYLVDDMDEVTGSLGPEPLSDEFTLDVFREAIRKRSGIIKALLLNQEFVAGVGNIYADEALHMAHIRPKRTADTLTDKEIEDLWNGIRTVLQAGIEREGASINWYRKPDGTKGTAQNGLLAYGRTGESCKTCGIGIIEKITVGQRGTHYCPSCQR
ncbi:MAG: bifunctional DNA-formamidopyrimidine glycosylase/DNA-(apurinic or apyrimidinic site) lyase [Chloroflexi bacterium]|nr:bifunctional DNA-formamidopyrimidine glycosylase/DNA-(apurinic or apyrimidinic site) lyase [Chloroflexota bacterium]